MCCTCAPADLTPRRVAKYRTNHTTAAAFSTFHASLVTWECCPGHSCIETTWGRPIWIKVRKNNVYKFPCKHFLQKQICSTASFKDYKLLPTLAMIDNSFHARSKCRSFSWRANSFVSDISLAALLCMLAISCKERGVGFYSVEGPGGHPREEEGSNLDFHISLGFC